MEYCLIATAQALEMKEKQNSCPHTTAKVDDDLPA
jgi:hypothetical protein